MKKTNIIYIVGTQFSGTTLISNILGTSNNAFNIGEINHLHQSVENKSKLCTCNENTTNCKFWSYIIKKANFSNLIKLSMSFFEKIKLGFFLFFGKIPSKYINKDISEDIKLYNNVLAKAKETKGDQVNIIVEHSKSLRRLIELDFNNNDNLDIQVIYPIKDSRGFIYSKNKRGKTILYGLFHWLFLNFFIDLYLKRFRKNDYIKIKYEDLTLDINKYVKLFNEKYGLDISQENLVNNLNDEPFHVFSGNPMKNKKIEKIQVDYSWKEKYGVIKKAFISIISWLPNKVLYKGKL